MDWKKGHVFEIQSRRRCRERPLIYFKAVKTLEISGESVIQEHVSLNNVSIISFL